MAKRIISSTILTVMLVLGASAAVLAGSLTQGFHSSTPLTSGAVVSIANSGSSEVQLTSANNELLLTGVVVDAKDAIIDLQPKGSDVRVALSGNVTILVSDITGEIKSGDSLIISPLAGITMKDSQESEARKYVAVAKQGFNSKSSGARQISVGETDGNKRDVAVGLIEATLLLSSRSSSDADKNKNAIVLIGERISGRPVSTARVVMSASVLIATFSITGFLLNGTIRGSFLSLGRNPLAKASIMSSLTKVVSVSLVIFTAGIAAAYVVLLF